MAWFSWQQAKQLDPSLKVLGDFFIEPPAKVQTLTGGLTNRCWRLDTSCGQSYVWRPASKVCEVFSITRQNEYQVLSAVRATGLAPQPVYVCEQGLLVTWLEGEVLPTSLGELDSILAIAARIHQLPTDSLPIAPFSYSARVDHYWAQLEPEYCGTRFEALYQRWRTAPVVGEVPKALCHFDLGSYNLVRGERGLQVIDWEYAALADPRLDLTLVIQLAQAPAEEAVRQYCRLREIKDISLWLEGVQAWQPRTTLMAMLWYLLAHNLWQDEQYLTSANDLKDLLCMEDHCFETQ
ncbi:phosphotransferase [Vibrio sp. CAU 1672]|uniref:phosphotransferase n=1 Tax=Vibrio sp. CAU 1672 TaxID=3032594 RepID=UPI0023DC0DDB|nr:phosphotransferase [Vibrio sp. CAU 1672]MDF2153619.1 phosphotransferase [Vibrio sp. CAU 1672]